jgi:hypothetical protein
MARECSGFEPIRLPFASISQMSVVAPAWPVLAGKSTVLPPTLIEPVSGTMSVCAGGLPVRNS